MLQNEFLSEAVASVPDPQQLQSKAQAEVFLELFIIQTCVVDYIWEYCYPRSSQSGPLKAPLSQGCLLKIYSSEHPSSCVTHCPFICITYVPKR